MLFYTSEQDNWPSFSYAGYTHTNNIAVASMPMKGKPLYMYILHRIAARKLKCKCVVVFSNRVAPRA